jgi:branched-chain amino acid transport system permease protein
MTNWLALARSRLAAMPSSVAISALIIGLLVAAMIYGGSAMARQIVSGLLLGSIYMTVAVAFTLTIGVLNFLNFTIPTLFMLTGMVAWGVMAKGYVKFAASWAWLLALAAGVAAAVIASLIVERFTFRYLKMTHGDATEHAIPLVSSLGFLLIYEHLVLIALGSESQRFGVPFNADVHIGGLVVGVPQIVSGALAIAIVATLSFVLRNTGIGRALRTIGENPDTASLLGVEIDRVVPVVFILTGLLAGVAGALFTVNYREVSPFMGDNVGTKAIAAMVLGGVGSIWGSIVGGFIVGVIETLSIYFFGGDSVQMVVWGLLLVIIIVRPQGLIASAMFTKAKM